MEINHRRTRRRGMSYRSYLLTNALSLFTVSVLRIYAAVLAVVSLSPVSSSCCSFFILLILLGLQEFPFALDACVASNSRPFGPFGNGVVRYAGAQSITFSFNQGPYMSQYLYNCNEARNYDGQRDRCPGLGTGYLHASFPTMASITALRNALNANGVSWRDAWVGTDDRNSEGVWRWTRGRLKDRLFTTGNRDQGTYTCKAIISPGFAESPTTFNDCPWEASEPDNENNAGCGLLWASGNMQLSDGGCAYSLPCTVCERSPCAMGADCNADNTNTVGGDYYPSCSCNCKSGTWGSRCEWPIVVTPSGTSGVTFRYGQQCAASALPISSGGQTTCAAITADGGGFHPATIPLKRLYARLTAINGYNGDMSSSSRPRYGIGAGDGASEGRWLWSQGRGNGLAFYSGGSCNVNTFISDWGKTLFSTTGSSCNWSPNEPQGGTGENCAQLRVPDDEAFGIGMDDISCSSTTACFLCERSPCTVGIDCYSSTAASGASGSYPNCKCTCNAGYYGDRCEYPLTFTFGNGVYTSDYVRLCSASAVTMAMADAQCRTVLGTAWALGTLPTKEVYDGFEDRMRWMADGDREGSAWLGGQSSGSSYAWAYGRLKGEVFSSGSACQTITYKGSDPGVSVTFNYCKWDATPPANRCPVMAEASGSTAQALGGAACTAGPKCYVCERSICKMGADCYTTRTAKVAGYYPDCRCTCKHGWRSKDCSLTVTASLSLTRLVTHSRSVAYTSSLSITVTVSSSRTTLLTPTRTRVATQTMSLTVTRSDTKTVLPTDTRTVLLTPSLTPSQTVTTTRSVQITSSRTVLLTASASLSMTLSHSTSASHSASVSLTATTSRVASTSVTMVATPTPTFSESMSVSISISTSQSSSLTATVSVSVTHSSSGPTPSVSGPTASATYSLVPTASTSLPETGTLTDTISLQETGSLSTPLTQSVSDTVSQPMTSTLSRPMSSSMSMTHTDPITHSDSLSRTVITPSVSATVQISPTGSLTESLSLKIYPPIPAEKPVDQVIGGVIVAGAIVSPVAGGTSVALALIRAARCGAEKDPNGDDEPLPMLVHPLRFATPASWGSDPSEGEFKGNVGYEQGSIIGNAIIIPFTVMLIIGGPVAWAVRVVSNEPSQAKAYEIIGWPSVCILPFTVLAEGLGSSLMALYYDGSKASYLIACVGLGMFFGVLFVWTWALFVRIPRHLLHIADTPLPRSAIGGVASGGTTDSPSSHAAVLPRRRDNNRNGNINNTSDNGPHHGAFGDDGDGGDDDDDDYGYDAEDSLPRPPFAGADAGGDDYEDIIGPRLGRRRAAGTAGRRGLLGFFSLSRKSTSSTPNAVDALDTVEGGGGRHVVVSPRSRSRARRSAHGRSAPRCVGLRYWAAWSMHARREWVLNQAIVGDDDSHQDPSDDDDDDDEEEEDHEEEGDGGSGSVTLTSTALASLMATAPSSNMMGARLEEPLLLLPIDRDRRTANPSFEDDHVDGAVAALPPLPMLDDDQLSTATVPTMAATTGGGPPARGWGTGGAVVSSVSPYNDSHQPQQTRKPKKLSSSTPMKKTKRFSPLYKAWVESMLLRFTNMISEKYLIAADLLCVLFSFGVGLLEGMETEGHRPFCKLQIGLMVLLAMLQAILGVLAFIPLELGFNIVQLILTIIVAGVTISAVILNEDGYSLPEDTEDMLEELNTVINVIGLLGLIIGIVRTYSQVHRCQSRRARRAGYRKEAADMAAVGEYVPPPPPIATDAMLDDDSSSSSSRGTVPRTAYSSNLSVFSDGARRILDTFRIAPPRRGRQGLKVLRRTEAAAKREAEEDREREKRRLRQDSIGAVGHANDDGSSADFTSLRELMDIGDEGDDPSSTDRRRAQQRYEAFAFDDFNLPGRALSNNEAHIIAQVLGDFDTFESIARQREDRNRRRSAAHRIHAMLARGERPTLYARGGTNNTDDAADYDAMLEEEMRSIEAIIQQDEEDGDGDGGMGAGDGGKTGRDNNTTNANVDGEDEDDLLLYGSSSAAAAAAMSGDWASDPYARHADMGTMLRGAASGAFGHNGAGRASSPRRLACGSNYMYADGEVDVEMADLGYNKGSSRMFLTPSSSSNLYYQHHNQSSSQPPTAHLTPTRVASPNQGSLLLHHPSSSSAHDQRHMRRGSNGAAMGPTPMSLPQRNALVGSSSYPMSPAQNTISPPHSPHSQILPLALSSSSHHQQQQGGGAVHHGVGSPPRLPPSPPPQRSSRAYSVAPLLGAYTAPPRAALAASQWGSRVVRRRHHDDDDRHHHGDAAECAAGGDDGDGAADLILDEYSQSRADFGNGAPILSGSGECDGASTVVLGDDDDDESAYYTRGAHDSTANRAATSTNTNTNAISAASPVGPDEAIAVYVDGALSARHRRGSSSHGGNGAARGSTNPSALAYQEEERRQPPATVGSNHGAPTTALASASPAAASPTTAIQISFP